MFRFIHCADIHLDSPLRGLEAHEDAPVAEIRAAARRAFDNLVTWAVLEAVDFVLIAGDLYDGDWKDYNTGLYFVERMGQLKRAGIRVFLVTGNHDASSQITKAMPLPDNVTLFPSSRPRSVFLEELGVAVHGVSYAGRVVSENLAAAFPVGDPRYFNIGLLHTSLNGRPGHADYAPCTLSDLLAKGYEYWALGHVHQREIVAQSPWVLFPGNIQGRHIRETGAKGASLVTVAHNRVESVVHHELDVLRWVECAVDVGGCTAREAIYDRVRAGMENELALASGRPLALRICLQGSCQLHSELVGYADRWTEEFRGLAAGLGDVWLEKVRFATTGDHSLEDPVAADTPLSGLLQALDGLAGNTAVLAELEKDLGELKRKLPAELQTGTNLREAAPEELAELEEEVRELLTALLLRQGGAHEA